MPISKVFSLSLHGIQGALVTVEIDIAPGLPTLTLVGLPDASVRESRDRVVSAVRNSGFEFPIRRITVNLAPADLRKEGPAFELPIAVGILVSAGVFKAPRLGTWCLAGELALDGTLRPVKGAMPMAIEARDRGFEGLILPADNYKEAAVIRGLKVFGAESLKQAVDFLRGNLEPPPGPGGSAQPAARAGAEPDFCDVKGQAYAKRAIEVACAGGHNILMIGPPGAGKTMLAKRVPSILPAMGLEESIETSKIHSAAGLLPREDGLVTARPFRNPHHSISDIALAGGGSYPRPGEISLAQNGVLFLDELPEFSRRALETLRQPLESREVVIARARHSLRFPANFMLVASMNPCLCGYQGHPSRGCVCSPLQAQKYFAKVSGPMMDRIDIHIEVPALKLDELTGDPGPAEPSAAIRARVGAARGVQSKRFAGERKGRSHDADKSRIHANAQMSVRQVKKYCDLDSEGKGLLRSAIERLGFSARAYDRILKVARTAADLEGSEKIAAHHVAEAIQYRSLDRAKV